MGIKSGTFFGVSVSQPMHAANTLPPSTVLRRFEDYLMDNYYRTENRDVQAQDVILEFGMYYKL